MVHLPKKKLSKFYFFASSLTKDNNAIPENSLYLINHNKEARKNTLKLEKSNRPQQEIQSDSKCKPTVD